MSEPAEVDHHDSGDQISQVAVIVRRVVESRVPDRDTADEIVQDTLARVLGTRARLDDRAMLPYAITVARNLVASHWRTLSTSRRHQHRLIDGRVTEQPEDRVVHQEETEAIRAALE